MVKTQLKEIETDQIGEIPGYCSASTDKGILPRAMHARKLAHSIYPHVYNLMIQKMTLMKQNRCYTNN